MIATLIVAGLFVIVGTIGGWILYMLSGMDGDICDTCGRESTRSERAAWIEYLRRRHYAEGCVDVLRKVMAAADGRMETLG